MPTRKGAGDTLPVDVERLRRQFPELTAEDLDAYVVMTRRILAERDPVGRARVTRETLTRARTARQGTPSTAEDLLALRYLTAVEKMNPAK